MATVPSGGEQQVNIPESIRSRARKVAQQFGYRPNALARLSQWALNLLASSAMARPMPDKSFEARRMRYGIKVILLIVDTNGENVEPQALNP